jgi:hypothetical protein
MSFQRFATDTIKNTTIHVFGTWRNVFLGAGLSYALQREEYTHVPLIIIFPSVYVGYHAHRNKDVLLDWIIESKKKLKGSWL